jgi:hypothetical protein
MKHYRTWPSILGFSILALAVLALLASTLIEAWVFHYSGGLVGMLMLLGASVAIFHEAGHLIRQEKQGRALQELVTQGLAVILGGLAAFAVSHELALGPVISASLVGLVASLISPKTSVAAYCGAFVGMTSDILFFNYYEVALAGVIAGIVFIFTQDTFNGVGGKLGTIALVGTAITSLSLQREFILLPIANWQTNAAVIIVCMVAAPLTFYFNIARKHGPVLASSIVGITAGLVLPVIFPQNGPTLAVVAICASFAGMTSEERCPTFWHILITGFFTSIIFVYSTPLLGGAGGKLGTIAFGAVLGTCGLKQLAGWAWGIIHSQEDGQDM